MKARHIPNMLTFSRLLFTIAFVAISIIDSPFHPAAMLCFFVGGMTDLIDGPLARKIKGGATDLGANLDANIDLVMVAAGVALIIPAMNIWPLLFPAVLVALGLKFTTGITSKIQHGKVFYTHTVLGKVVIMLLFLGANIYFILHTAGLNAGSFLNWYLVVCIAMVVVHCLEEHLIVAKIEYPEKNTKTIFHVKGLNEKYHATRAGDEK
ncbi:MAG: CDP-alcohol phosphatidyltransferase family protein [Oscillospiraceae bacterium]|nr:CDP-alcohol phosphatidyltransferase family protein [Oscillospiraceae bacterium]